MLRFILLGLAAAAFFSTTFILNRAMSLSGGHWVWSASLRYAYMALFLIFWVLLRTGPRRLLEILQLFRRHVLFWVIAGTIGFGVFYSMLCYAADHAPAWILAATWQSTILATPVVLFFFGRRVPPHGVLFALLIFAGIVLVNSEQAEGQIELENILMGVLPVLAAAFAYPIGNQMLNTARHGGQGPIPPILSPVLHDASSCVLLMTLGSVPFWFLLIAASSPPPPTPDQWVHTALVALFSGVIATSIFYKARNATTSPIVLAAVDATQAGEVGFSLLGEILLLGGAPPNLLGSLGLILMVAGLVSYSLREIWETPGRLS